MPRAKSNVTESELLHSEQLTSEHASVLAHVDTVLCKAKVEVQHGKLKQANAKIELAQKATWAISKKIPEHSKK